MYYWIEKVFFFKSFALSTEFLEHKGIENQYMYIYVKVAHH